MMFSFDFFLIIKSTQARKVYLTALSMYRSFDESEQFMAPIMYCMFAKLEIENDRAAEALKILVSMSTDTSYGKLIVVLFHLSAKNACM